MASSTFASKYGPWALVTGASSGIGLAFATALASRGLHVVLIARREDRLRNLATTLSRQYGIETKVIVADLADESECKRIETETDGVDIGLLVNNAGCYTVGSFFRDAIDKHEQVINVNIRAVTALAHSFGRRFADRGKGGIIFVSSVSSVAMPWSSTYGASKAYVSALSVILEQELKGKGVDVLCLEPAPTKTEMQQEASQVVDFDQFSSIMSAEECVREALERIAEGGRWTPGLGNRIQIAIIRAMPDWVRMKVGGWMLERSIKKEVLEF